MAKDPRWTRYRPPSEKRREDGSPAKVKPIPKPASKATSKPAAKPAGTAKRSTSSRVSMVPWLVGLAVVGVIVVITVVVAKVGSGESGGDNPKIDRKTLNVQFLTDGLALIEEKNDTGTDPVSVRLSGYELSVEYFNPNTQETTEYSVDTYSKGYEVRIEENHYSDYQPRRFELSMVTPQLLIDAADKALDKTNNATYFDVRVEADAATGAVTIVASASGDERVEVTTGPLTTSTASSSPGITTTPTSAATAPSPTE